MSQQNTDQPFSYLKLFLKHVLPAAFVYALVTAIIWIIAFVHILGVGMLGDGFDQLRQ